MRGSTKAAAATLALALGAAGLAGDAMATCKKMGFLVNDYGKDGPTKDAMDLLDKHVAKWAADEGVTNYTVGKKDVSCELFLNFIVFDEHTCTASANVCWNEGPASAKDKTAATGAPAADGKTGATSAPTGDSKTAEKKKSAAVSEKAKAAAKPASEDKKADAAEAAATDAAKNSPAASPVETGTVPKIETPEAAPAVVTETSAAEKAAAAAERAAAAAERAAAAAERAAQSVADRAAPAAPVAADAAAEKAKDAAVATPVAETAAKVEPMLPSVPKP